MLGVRTLAELLDHFPIEGRISSGLRLVTKPRSTTTSRSTQFPPAFLISVFSHGQDVTVLPLTPPASTRSQGPRQLAATGLSRADASGLRLVLPDALQAQALVALRQRRWGHATDALEQALALSRAMGYPYAEAKGLYVYGLLHQQKGEPKQAAERLTAALTILNQLGGRFYAEHVEQALAESERR